MSASCDPAPSPNWDTEINLFSSPRMIDIVVSRRGSSNAVGSDNICFLMSKWGAVQAIILRTYESKMPNDMAIGVLWMCKGNLIVREQRVRPVSSLYVALGSWATKERIIVNVLHTIKPLHEPTISQGGHHCNQSRVKSIAVVIDAGGIDVEYPCGFTRVNAQGWQGNYFGADGEEMSVVNRIIPGCLTLYSRNQSFIQSVWQHLCLFCRRTRLKFWGADGREIEVWHWIVSGLDHRTESKGSTDPNILLNHDLALVLQSQLSHRTRLLCFLVEQGPTRRQSRLILQNSLTRSLYRTRTEVLRTAYSPTLRDRSRQAWNSRPSGRTFSATNLSR